MWFCICLVRVGICTGSQWWYLECRKFDWECIGVCDLREFGCCRTSLNVVDALPGHVCTELALRHRSGKLHPGRVGWCSFWAAWVLVATTGGCKVGVVSTSLKSTFLKWRCLLICRRAAACLRYCAWSETASHRKDVKHKQLLPLVWP